MESEFDILNKYEECCYDNEDNFLLKFAQGNTLRLARVSFTSKDIHYVYIMKFGRHVTNSAPIEKFILWYDENKLI